MGGYEAVKLDAQEENDGFIFGLFAGGSMPNE